MPPFAIEPVDTTGAGDSFRAGIVYAFLRGWDDARAMTFAAAIAAINCARFPGVLNSPSIDEVDAFIAAAGRARQPSSTTKNGRLRKGGR
jgi:sugar/nucleoside kinase (ribokinase family)